MYGREEVHVIDGGGDDIAARVSVSGEGAGDVDPMHEASAEQGVEGIGVVGENDFGHLGLGLARETGLQVGNNF